MPSKSACVTSAPASSSARTHSNRPRRLAAIISAVTPSRLRDVCTSREKSAHQLGLTGSDCAEELCLGHAAHEVLESPVTPYNEANGGTIKSAASLSRTRSRLHASA
jgi:hypothetical protein